MMRNGTAGMTQLTATHNNAFKTFKRHSNKPSHIELAKYHEKENADKNRGDTGWCLRKRDGPFE